MAPGTAKGEGGVNPTTATYLNRLSDLLFILARWPTCAGGDVLWQPGGGRAAAPTRGRKGGEGAVTEQDDAHDRRRLTREREPIAASSGSAAQATLTLKPVASSSSHARSAV